MNNTFEVRDMRKKEKFFVDDEYLNGYAKHLGATPSMVYFVLCRHASRSQECFPSMETIGDKVGIKRHTVIRSIKKLEEWNLIQKGDRKRYKSGKYMHNTYVLMDKSVWKSKPCSTDATWSPCSTGVPSHVASDDVTMLHPCNTKDTHKKEDTHIKDTHKAEQSSADISQLIKEFESINPACKRMYGNKTQRQACSDLIENYTYQRVVDVIQKVLPKSNEQTYMPTITTPLVLFQKWSNLESALLKTKNKVEQESEPVYF